MPFTPDSSSYPTSSSRGFVPDQSPVSKKILVKKDALQVASDIGGFLFPGTKQIGESLGTIAAAGERAVQGDFLGAKNILDSQVSVPKLIGAYTAAGATAGAATVGGGTALGRIGLQTGFGGTIGGGSALANGASLPGIAKSTLGGALIGGVSQGLGEGISAGLKQLPTRIVQKALNGTSPETASRALSSTKLGSIANLQKDSETAVKALSQKVESALSHSKYTGVTTEPSIIINKTISQFPDSQYTTRDILNASKSLIPDQAANVEKFLKGTATIKETNAIRRALDMVNNKVFTKLNVQPAKRELLAAFQNELRDYVQTTAKETQPIFAELAQEINLRNALRTTTKKLDAAKAIGLYDLVSALPGLVTMNPVTGIAGVAAQKAVRSPAVQIGAAKAIPAIQRFGTTIGSVGRPGAVQSANQK